MTQKGEKMRKILRKIKDLCLKDKYSVAENGIAFLNYDDGVQRRWISKFIEYNFPNTKKYNICLTSINGRRTRLTSYPGRKIFVTGENVDRAMTHKYTRVLRNDYFRFFSKIQERFYDNRVSDSDLSLGFSDYESLYKNYLRFPIWITYLLSPYDTVDDIKKVVKSVNSPRFVSLNTAVCLNSHDTYGLRTKICDDLRDIIDIKYPGRWRHNDDNLWSAKYNNNKREYLKEFRFNICSENMDVPCYCTEKLFDSFYSGCIPIYSGSMNNPEPELINHDAVVFWELDDQHNFSNKKEVRRLMEDQSYYEKFVRQEKLRPVMVDYLVYKLEKLKAKISELV